MKLIQLLARADDVEKHLARVANPETYVDQRLRFATDHGKVQVWTGADVALRAFVSGDRLIARAA